MTTAPAHYPLSTAEACRIFHVSRNTLAAWRKRGVVKAINANPGGERAVWRYADRLEGSEDLEGEAKFLDLKRRAGL